MWLEGKKFGQFLDIRAPVSGDGFEPKRTVGLFEILACVRQVDPWQLVYWSMIQSLASYGWGVASKSQKYSCFWGNTCHPITRNAKMKEMMDGLLDRHIKLLSSKQGLVLVYDSYQRSQQLKHWQNKRSFDFVKGTHQLVVKLNIFCKQNGTIAL